MGAVSPLLVLAQANAERVDEPVGLLAIIAVLLAVLGLLVAALTVLYVRATRPPRSVESAPQPSGTPDQTGPRPTPVSEAGSSRPPPPRRRSPVLRSRASLWRR